MFVDASVLVAILVDEPDGMLLAEKIRRAPSPITSAVAVFETVLAVSRVGNGDVGAARRDVGEFLRRAGVRLIEVGEDEMARALDAFDRFGKGRHPARLNMGDCFAYACARTHGVPLLFKGDDFGQTDIAIA